MRRAILGLVFAAAVASAARPAGAYSGTEHIRHADQAYQILNVLRRGAAYAVQAQRLDPVGARAGKYRPLSECPLAICPPITCPGGACAEGRRWRRFIEQALEAPAKLDRLRTDLADPPQRLVSDGCGHELPKLGRGELAQCRIGELPFAPRSGWGTSPNECSLRRDYIIGGADQNAASTPGHPSGPVFPFYQDLQTNLSGAALGMWATGPDEAKDDTHLWLRPSNLAFQSEMRRMVSTAGAVGAGVTAVLIAPLVCAGSWIFGSGDCFADAVSAAQYPSRIADSTVGIFEQSTLGQFTDIDAFSSDVDLRLPLPGLWHFGRVDIPGQFNEVGGLKLFEGGPDGEVDALDQAVICVTDFLGVTVKSDDSQGVARYGAFADGGLRLAGDWLGPTVGHVEFEPLQNLAQWGWTQFRAGKLNAKGLGWVLHAIGDAGQPHHTISSIGWGHAEWETFANLSWEESFHEEDVVWHYAHLQQAMATAFRWWTFLDERQPRAGAPDLAVREMIVALLTETTYLPVSRVGRAYRRYLSGFKTAPEAMIRQAYGQEANTMRDLMVRAIGASMAFLVKASDFVSMAGDSPCDCGPGASRFAQDASGKLVTAHDGLCHACGRGAFAQMPGWADGVCVAACPPDRPTVQDGKCVAVGACPDSTPFVEAGRCVAWCSGNKVVVNNRSCEDRCPAPQQADAAGFCRVLPAPAPRRCRETADDVARACCSRVGAPASTAAECCSGDRRPDGFCRGLAGEPCVIDGDCVSLTCTGHRCAPPENGGRCLKDGECASGLCAEEHICLGLTGDPCTSAAACDSRVCLGGRCGAGP